MRWLVLVLLLTIPFSYAFDDYHTSQSLTLKTEISSDVENVNNIEILKINISFFPSDSDFQKITNMDLPPNTDRSTNYLITQYDNLDQDILDYNLKFDLTSDFSLKEIKNKILFPINSIPSEYETYLLPTEHINSDDELITETASKIIGDEDDLYEAVFKIAEWGNTNINYSLETLTEELTQDSRWVLENRKGVCDELTVLFIAMLRSQGIPAKFVSGQSYTSIIPGFGNHAWAEVYFPGKGWVPFDVTYGQYGYVDATHIKMKESVTARETSVRYIWSPGNLQIEPGDINITTNIISEEEEIENIVNLEIKLLKNKVRTGSFIPMEIELENLKDYYISTTLQITKSASTMTDNTKPVLLKPEETKKVYWIIPLPTLENGFTYTSNIEIIEFFGEEDSKEVEYSDNYPYYSLQEAEDRIYQLSLENQNPESELDLFCNPDKISYYDYQSATLICKIINSENKNHNLNLCFLHECEEVEIGKEEKQISFDIPLNHEGTKEHGVQLTGQDVLKNSYFDVNVIPPPDLKINNLEYPSQIKYGEKSSLFFNLNSKSPAKEVLVKLNNKELFSFEFYEENEKFEVPFSSNYFNTYKDSKIKISYKDFNGEEYSTEEDINIEVTDVPFYVKIGYWWFVILGIILTLIVIRRKFFKLNEPPMK